MPKNSSTSENYSPTPNVNHSIIYNLSLSNETLTFIHVFNNLETNCAMNKIMKHKNIKNHTKITEHSNTRSSKTNWVRYL